jgi:hypothetical protein
MANQLLQQTGRADATVEHFRFAVFAGQSNEIIIAAEIYEG